MTPTTENWRPVPTFEGIYEVSDLGNLRRLARVVKDCNGHNRRLRARHLEPFVNRNNGRRMIVFKVGGRIERRTVSSVVLEAFAGPRPPGMVCCHDDGNALNDQLSNLRWDTQSANLLDEVRHGTHAMINRTHCPSGHPLSPPNLIPSNLRREVPGRACLACSRARGNAAHERRMGRPAPDHQLQADYHYARLTRGISANGAA